MSDFDTLTRLLVGLFGLVVIAAATLAFFRASFAKQQIELLRGERDDAKDKIERLTKDLEAERALRETLEKKVGVLEQVVTGREQLDHLQASLDSHDRKVDERHIALIRIMEDTRSSVGNVEDLIIEVGSQLESATRVVVEKIEEVGDDE